MAVFMFQKTAIIGHMAVLFLALGNNEIRSIHITTVRVVRLYFLLLIDENCLFVMCDMRSCVVILSTNTPASNCSWLCDSILGVISGVKCICHSSQSYVCLLPKW